MADFVDVLDPSRIVSPLSDLSGKDKTVVCRVFWREQIGDKEVRVSGGMTNLPKQLFLSGEEREYEVRARIGFLPLEKAERLQEKARKKPAKKQRPRDDEEFED